MTLVALLATAAGSAWLAPRAPASGPPMPTLALEGPALAWQCQCRRQALKDPAKAGGAQVTFKGFGLYLLGFGISMLRKSMQYQSCPVTVALPGDTVVD